MVETPLSKVARLIGGVALMQGRLGHQVLGQLLIAGTNELAVAGAAVAVAGAARSRSTPAQLVINTAAPVLAVHVLFDKREQMLRHLERELLRRAQAIGASDFALETQNGALKRLSERLVRVNAGLRTTTTDLRKTCEHHRKVRRRLAARAAVERRKKSALKSENEGLHAANTDLQAEVAALHKKSALADQVHHEFEHALKHLRVERSTLKNDKARCVVEKYILQRRNTDLREEIKALRKAIGADETPASEADEAPPDTTGPKPK